MLDGRKDGTMAARSNQTHLFARLSLGSVLLTSLTTTFHHYDRLGFYSVFLGLVITGVPIAAIWWFRRSRGLLPFLAYALVSGWVIVGFGLIDGMWRSTLKLFMGHFLLANYSQYFSWAPVGTFPFEATGIVASVSSLFAGYYTLRFLFLARSRVRAPALRHRSVAIVGAAVALLVAGYLVERKSSHAAVPPTGDVVRIGVIVPTQGPAALLGSSFLKAVQLAHEDLKGTKRRYELVLADTGTNPVQTKAAIQKLIAVDKVQAIVGGISLPGEVIQPYATYAGIPHLCVCSVRRIGDGEYNFTNIPLPEDEAKRWVEEAQRRGVKTVALLTQDYPSIDGHVRALKEELAKAHVDAVYVNRFAGATTDFRSIIAEAAASKPDVFFVEAAPPALDILGEQLNDAKIHNLSSIVALSLSNRPELFEGAWYTDSNLADPTFKARFEEKYPDTRFATHMMPYAYDSLRLLVEGFESGKNVADYVRETTDYAGKAGRVTRAPGSGNFRSRPAVWMMNSGKPTWIN
jgi:ABC-type branched-subunit amino acid transport system substrate-binding protein